jgi:hypothetical protein
MFRQQMCHPQGACFVTLLNYISTIAALKHLKAELNPIRHLLALAGAHHFVDVSRIRVKYIWCRNMWKPNNLYIYIYILIIMCFLWLNYKL